MAMRTLSKSTRCSLITSSPFLISKIAVLPSTRFIKALRVIAIPKSANDCRRIGPIASSSSRANSESIAAIVTLLPSIANACPISIPIGPAPMMSVCFGTSSSSNTFWLVKTAVSCKPGTSIIRGLEPVAITAVLY